MGLIVWTLCYPVIPACQESFFNPSLSPLRMRGDAEPHLSHLRERGERVRALEVQMTILNFILDKVQILVGYLDFG